MFHVPKVTDKKWPHQHKFPLIDLLDNSRQTELQDNVTDSTAQSSQSSGFVSSVLAELVDIFPTLSDLAGLSVPPVCPVDTFHTDFCAEGVSLVPVIHNVTATSNDVLIKRWKNASFSQYPRPTFYPSHKTNTPELSMIKFMGYSMHTKKYRYVEWLPFNNKNFIVDWSNPVARELYSYQDDPLEMKNVVNASEYQNLVKKGSGLN